MTPTSQLTGSHLRTYQAIFQHPISHNLGWREVHALFRHIGKVEEEPNRSLKVTRNGQILVLHPSRTKDVAETAELKTSYRIPLGRSTIARIRLISNGADANSILSPLRSHRHACLLLGVTLP